MKAVLLLSRIIAVILRICSGQASLHESIILSNLSIIIKKPIHSLRCGVSLLVTINDIVIKCPEASFLDNIIIAIVVVMMIIITAINVIKTE